MRAEVAALAAKLGPLEPYRRVLLADDVALQREAGAPARPPIYVVIHDSTPLLRSPSLDGRPATSRGYTFSLMHVGTTTGEVRDLVEAVTDLLLGQRLTVDGRVSSPLRKVSGSPLMPQTEVSGVYAATDVWRCVFDR